MAQVLGINPVAGVTTTFKVRFPTSTKPLPPQSHVHVYFPKSFLVQSDAVSSKRNIECDFEIISTETVPETGQTRVTLGIPPPAEEEDAKGKAKPPAKPDPDVRVLVLLAQVARDFLKLEIL